MTPLSQKNSALERNHPVLFGVSGMVMVATIAFMLIGVTLVNRFSGQLNQSVATVLPSVLVDLANADRSGKPAFTVNPLLEKAAQLKANDMATKGYFAHTAPDGTEPWYWLSVAGYSYRAAGENLAVHFEESIAIHAAWMASPSHRANVINPEFTEIGIGVAVGMFEGRETIFVAQFFGRPIESGLVLGTGQSASTQNKVSVSTSDTVGESEIGLNPNSDAIESGTQAEADTIAVVSQPDGSIEEVEAMPVVTMLEEKQEIDVSLSGRRLDVLRLITYSPFFGFATLIALCAAILSAVLMVYLHRHETHHRFAPIGAVLMVLSITSSVFFLKYVDTNDAGSFGKTTEVSAFVFLVD